MTTTYSILDMGLTDQQLFAHMDAMRAAACRRDCRPRTPEEQAEMDAILDELEASWGR